MFEFFSHSIPENMFLLIRKLKEKEGIEENITTFNTWKSRFICQRKNSVEFQNFKRLSIFVEYWTYKKAGNNSWSNSSWLVNIFNKPFILNIISIKISITQLKLVSLEKLPLYFSNYFWYLKVIYINNSFLRRRKDDAGDGKSENRLLYNIRIYTSETGCV